MNLAAKYELIGDQELKDEDLLKNDRFLLKLIE